MFLDKYANKKYFYTVFIFLILFMLKGFLILHNKDPVPPKTLLKHPQLAAKTYISTIHRHNTFPLCIRMTL